MIVRNRPNRPRSVNGEVAMADVDEDISNTADWARAVEQRVGMTEGVDALLFQERVGVVQRCARGGLVIVSSGNTSPCC